MTREDLIKAIVKNQNLIESITAKTVGKWISKDPTKAVGVAGIGTYAAGSALRRRNAKKVKQAGHRDIPQYVQKAGIGRGIKGLGKAAIAGAMLTPIGRKLRAGKGLTLGRAVTSGAGIAIGASAVKDVRHAIRTKRKFRPQSEHKRLRKSYEYTNELRKTLR